MIFLGFNLRISDRGRFLTSEDATGFCEGKDKYLQIVSTITDILTYIGNDK